MARREWLATSYAATLQRGRVVRAPGGGIPRRGQRWYRYHPYTANPDPLLVKSSTVAILRRRDENTGTRVLKKTTGDIVSRTVKTANEENLQHEIVELVLEGMAEGHTLSETVKKVSRLRGQPLTPGTVRRWIIAEEAYYTRYQKTKTMLGQAFAEEAILVARESTSSTTAMDRVLIETLKWAAAKANPVEYGEKQTVEHQGSQTLSVKIVEDDAPVRNQKALEAGKVSAVISAPLVFAVPAKTAEHEDDDYTFV